MSSSLDLRDSPSDVRPPPTFSLQLNPSWGYRRFVDAEASTTDKRFGTPGVFLMGTRAEVYPLSTVREAGGLRDIGIVGTYTRALTLALKDFDTSKDVDSVWYSYSAGVRGRVMGRATPFALGLSAQYERWVFEIDPSTPQLGLVPTASYSILALGVDARQSFGPFSMYLDVALLYAFTIDPLGDRQPGRGGLGVRGTFGLAVRLVRAVEIDVHLTPALVTYSLATLPDRDDQPGRVRDEYLVSSLGLRLLL